MACVYWLRHKREMQSRRGLFLFTLHSTLCDLCDLCDLRASAFFSNLPQHSRNSATRFRRSPLILVYLIVAEGSWKTLRRGGRREFSKITVRRFTLPSNLSSVCQGSPYQHVFSKDHSVL